MEIILLISDLNIRQIGVSRLDFLQRAIRTLITVLGGFSPRDAFGAPGRILLFVRSWGRVRDRGRSFSWRLIAFIDIMFSKDVLAHRIVG